MRLIYIFLLICVNWNFRVIAQDADILVVPKGTTAKFWTAIKSGAEKASSDFKVSMIWRGPSEDWDVQAQLNIVNKYLNSNIRVLVIAPNNAELLVEPIKKMMAKGKKVVIFDSALNYNEIETYVATDNFKAGEELGRVVLKQLPKNGQVIIVKNKAGNESTEKREQGFFNVLSSSNKNIKVVANVYGDAIVGKAYRNTKELLVKYPYVSAIFSSSEPNFEGVARAISETNRKDIIVAGFDINDQIYKNLKTGVVDLVVLQDPVMMGYNSIKAAKMILENKPIKKMINTPVIIATSKNYQEPKVFKYIAPTVSGK